jgi:hypothetical protein
MEWLLYELSWNKSPVQLSFEIRAPHLGRAKTLGWRPLAGRSSAGSTPLLLKRACGFAMRLMDKQYDKMNRIL